MLDDPEKSQPNRFWNKKKKEKAKTIIVKWLYSPLSLALYFPNIAKSTKIRNWACNELGTKKKSWFLDRIRTYDRLNNKRASYLVS